MTILISCLTFITVAILSLQFPYIIVKIYAIKYHMSYDDLINSDYGPYDMYTIGAECDDVFLKNFFISAFILSFAMLFTCTSLESNLVWIRLVSVSIVAVGDFITMLSLRDAIISVVTSDNYKSIKI